MTYRTERLLWIFTTACLTTAAALWLAGSFPATSAVAGARADDGRIAYRPAPEPRLALAAMANRVTEQDPFRADRKQAPLPFSHLAEGMSASPPPPPAPPKPPLFLRGTVGGPKWEALLEGVPGREGSVLVLQGDTIAGLRVRRTSRDTVVVTGMDTTWTLTVRHTWP
jgi:hypothetical protein